MFTTMWQPTAYEKETTLLALCAYDEKDLKTFCENTHGPYSKHSGDKTQTTHCFDTLWNEIEDYQCGLGNCSGEKQENVIKLERPVKTIGWDHELYEKTKGTYVSYDKTTKYNVNAKQSCENHIQKCKDIYKDTHKTRLKEEKKAVDFITAQAECEEGGGTFDVNAEECTYADASGQTTDNGDHYDWSSSNDMMDNPDDMMMDW